MGQVHGGGRQVDSGDAVGYLYGVHGIQRQVGRAGQAAGLGGLAGDGTPGKQRLQDRFDIPFEGPEYHHRIHRDQRGGIFVGQVQFDIGGPGGGGVVFRRFVLQDIRRKAGTFPAGMNARKRQEDA